MKQKYVHSTHCVYNIGYHLIWCTKYRKKLIYGEIETLPKRLVRAKCVQLGIQAAQLETMPDHVYVFVTSRQVIDPSHIVQQLKGYTSRELLTLFPRLRRRDGEHPSSGASHTSAKASDTYHKIRSGDIFNCKNYGDLLRSHLRVKTPQFSRLMS